MFHPRRFMLLGVLLALLILAACGQSGASTGGTAATAVPQATQAPQASAPTAVPAVANATAAPAATAATMAGGGDDLLADVKKRGKLLVATDANYKPQSFKNPDGSFEGFDIDVAKEVAKRLGVEVEFIDVNFDLVTAGGWNGRWDIDVGSVTITPERKQALYFSSPYYYAGAAFAVHKDNTASIDDLKGKKVGVGAATTYLAYLQGNLKLEGEQILKPAPEGITPQIYDTDQLALTDLALGNGTRLDAVLTAQPTILTAIQDGQPFKVLGDPVYYEDNGIVLDQKSPKDSKSLTDAITKIVDDMHKDGTLTKLSNKYYGTDLTTKK